MRRHLFDLLTGMSAPPGNTTLIVAFDVLMVRELLCIPHLSPSLVLSTSPLLFTLRGHPTAPLGPPHAAHNGAMGILIRTSAPRIEPKTSTPPKKYGLYVQFGGGGGGGVFPDSKTKLLYGHCTYHTEKVSPRSHQIWPTKVFVFMD